MSVEANVLELDEDVDPCCVEDVLALELEVDVDSCAEEVLALELAALAPTGEPFLALNWVRTTKEERATRMTTTTKVELFLVRLVMTCFSLAVCK